MYSCQTRNACRERLTTRGKEEECRQWLPRWVKTGNVSRFGVAQPGKRQHSNVKPQDLKNPIPIKCQVAPAPAPVPTPAPAVTPPPPAPEPTPAPAPAPAPVPVPAPPAQVQDRAPKILCRFYIMLYDFKLFFFLIVYVFLFLFSLVVGK